jgi:hypothetical protein
VRSYGAAGACRARLRDRRPQLLLVSAATVLGAVLAVGFSARFPGLGVSTAVISYGGLALTGSLVGGWIGRESGSRVAVQWAQLPANPLLLHGLRFATLIGTALILVGLQVLLIVGLCYLVGMGNDAVHLLAGLPGTTLVCLVFGTLIWTSGGWGVGGDGWAALLLGAALSILELLARLQPEWLGPIAGPADVIGLPLDDVGLASGFLAGRDAGAWAALVRVFAWLAAWAIIGALGVHTRCRRYSPRRS